MFFNKKFGDVLYIRRLVNVATHRDGREKRRVGFEQGSLERRRRQIGESRQAVYTDVEIVI